MRQRTFALSGQCSRFKMVDLCGSSATRAQHMSALFLMPPFCAGVFFVWGDHAQSPSGNPEAVLLCLVFPAWRATFKVLGALGGPRGAGRAASLPTDAWSPSLLCEEIRIFLEGAGAVLAARSRILVVDASSLPPRWGSLRVLPPP
jgi:hypothetical protein